MSRNEFVGSPELRASNRISVAKHRAKVGPEIIRARARSTYQNTRPYNIGRAKTRRSLAQSFIDAARAGGCFDCGNMNLSVLHSDHVRGEKLASVGEMAVRGYALSAIFAELDKCETVCANCHMLRTRDRRGVKTYLA